MNTSLVPQWLSPGWIALGALICVAIYLHHRSSVDRQRHERACREAEGRWPQVRGLVFSFANSALPQIVIEVPRGPQRGKYLVEVSASQRDKLTIGQELVCRIGHHPGDRVTAPRRCIFEQAL